nr:sigma-70 family RNA polymerase sigma factor [Rhodococcus sp. (in: high G+C Gram-positive bacteria)]
MLDDAVSAAITRTARDDSERVIAALTTRFGDSDLANEAVQDALEEATGSWASAGIPKNPGGWLMTVARNKAVDRLRRASSAYRRTIAAARDLIGSDDEESPGAAPKILDEAIVRDEYLRLLLLCAHPALDQDVQTTLMLRLVAGLTTREIASAYLVPDTTIGQRIVRAKRKIRDARIPLVVPADLSTRVGTLASVLYLIFNEGYLGRGDRADVLRVTLMDRAIGVTESSVELLPDHVELAGLLALQLFHRSRSRARVDSTVDPLGEMVLLPDQDRSLWDRTMIERANRILFEALSRMDPGPFQMQAIIASCHANAPSADRTDWKSIVACYDQLVQMTPSPIVALNRGVAIAMADGPQAGRRAIESVEGLSEYHLFHAALAETYARAGDTTPARRAFESALSLTTNQAERKHLQRRIADCT